VTEPRELTDSTKKAKALLAAASKPCSFAQGYGPCLHQERAKEDLAALAPDILAWAISVVEVLEDADCAYDHATYYHPGRDCLEFRFCDVMCSRCKALAAWAELERKMPCVGRTARRQRRRGAGG
jgi:hypothetical protein